jgi:F0F1-type ATP synthase assembly protein I
VKEIASGIRAAALVTQMGVLTILGALAGWWLDARFDTGRGLLLVGLFGGFTLGMVALFRYLSRPEPSDDDQRPPDPPQ